MRKLTPFYPHEIADVEVTDDCLTSRAGLNLFVRYLKGINLLPRLVQQFGAMRKHPKGLSVDALFTQIFCFFVDGTSRHLTHFDRLAKDPGYAAVIETAQKDMASSHQVKRFFAGFFWLRLIRFRQVLLQLFIWRLRITQPALVQLGLDTMVMDNNDAHCREGVKPTYKKVKGFAPLQLTWGRFIIDAIFRSGDKHSNHGDDAAKLIRQVVKLIRDQYSPSVPILIRMDGGFFDQDLFSALDDLEIGYCSGGRWYGDLRSFIQDTLKENWISYDEQPSEEGWEYLDFQDQRKNWDRPRRVVCCRTTRQGQQMLLPGMRPGTLIYTNLGQGGPIDAQLEQAGLGWMTSAKALVRSYADRGTDELVHRSLKEFGSQTLPFKGFSANAAFYYCMLIAFFLFESFKEDVTPGVLPVSAYPTTLRRTLIDLAAKVVSHAGKLILKVTRVVMETLNFKQLWRKAGSPPCIAWG